MSGTAAPRRVLAPPRASRQERAARTLLWAGAAAGLFLLAENLKGVAAEFPGDLLLAVLIEAVVALAGFGLLRRLRPIHPPPWGPSGASLAWGATAAAGCALPANGGLMAVWSKTGGTGFADEWGAALTAPVNEETLKAAGIVMLALAAPYALRGPVDGMMLGALTGLGFQVTENVIYGANSIIQSGGVEPGLSVVRTSLLRVGVTGPGSHWTMTAVAGAGIGYLVARVCGARGTPCSCSCARTGCTGSSTRPSCRPAAARSSRRRSTSSSRRSSTWPCGAPTARGRGASSAPSSRRGRRRPARSSSCSAGGAAASPAAASPRAPTTTPSPPGSRPNWTSWTPAPPTPPASRPAADAAPRQSFDHEGP
ncbi:PrsW family intramembrane metalloprotease [Actinomadura sp. J1-007]|uniref:PrsW family intramembrane metalloprotease n=1 Tax=Actinomadura sp. J1-007 TaxID=2661913 RepID=UPI001323F0FA|nr:PrsW family intramembrane metalloprotease [Actinomadura sp. J1-007]MWK39647.1 PrsW family intramembrane metalloprotease [Actinomadura sp. J1-007]